MTRHFTPKWKDKDGNVIIFPARNTLFDDYHSAQDYQLGEFIWFIPFGLSPAGILEFEAVDGCGEIPHVKATLGPLGECSVIDGPALQAARTK